jgi:hypothetical protein
MNFNSRVVSITLRAAFWPWAGPRQRSQPAGAGANAVAPAAAPAMRRRRRCACSPGAPTRDFKTLDQEVQGLKKDVIDLNKDLFVLEEELLFPGQHPGRGVPVDGRGHVLRAGLGHDQDRQQGSANYLYTAREADALLKGGVQQNLPRQSRRSASTSWWRSSPARARSSATIGAARPGVRKGRRRQVPGAQDHRPRAEAPARVLRQRLGMRRERTADSCARSL